MKKSKIKFILIFAVLIVLVVFTVACGKKKSNDSNAEETDSTEQTCEGTDIDELPDMDITGTEEYDTEADVSASDGDFKRGTESAGKQETQGTKHQNNMDTSQSLPEMASLAEKNTETAAETRAAESTDKAPSEGEGRNQEGIILPDDIF